MFQELLEEAASFQTTTMFPSFSEITCAPARAAPSPPPETCDLDRARCARLL